MAATVHNSLGQKLKAARTRLGLTQAEVGRRTDLSPVQISLYETNKREPSLTNLAKLCVALAVTSDELLGLAEVMDHQRQQAVSAAHMLVEMLEGKEQGHG
jgi:transcriptional regulator with XRE-family HTH domain